MLYYSDIEGLTPLQIQNKFALPTTPKYYCFVQVPAETDLFIGIVNKSSVGGTIQYELKTRLPESSFGKKIKLTRK